MGSTSVDVLSAIPRGNVLEPHVFYVLLMIYIKYLNLECMLMILL